MRVGIVSSLDFGKIVEHVEVTGIDEVVAVASTRSWTPAEFTGDRRVNAAFKSTALLVLDVDSGWSLDDAKVALAEYQYVILASKSHQREKNGVICDRYRVIMFLHYPITDEATYRATWATAKARWPAIDKQCSDPARFYYPSPIELARQEKLFGEYPVTVSATGSIPLVSATPVVAETKGELWKSTLRFLLEGAPAGHRHGELVKAAMNMREQGYSEDEVVSRVDQMIQASGNWGSPSINPKDLATIRNVFSRPVMKFERVEEQPLVPISIEADKLLDEAFDYLSDKNKVKGEPTGIEGLDSLLGGGRRTGELTVLMAQAKTGKNALYHYLLVQGLDRGMTFGYASRELDPATEVIPNLLSIKLGKNMWDEDLTDELRAEARKILSGWKLYFAPGYGTFPSRELEDWFRRMSAEGVQHFMFDHFHYALNREDYESTVELAKLLKSLTKELQIHIDLIVQPRSLREGEQLSLATLRGGAAIGQALDNLFIFERVRDPNHPNISQLKLEVARHKLARPGKIFLKYDPVTTSFEEVEVIDVPVPPHEGPPRGFEHRRLPRVGH